MWRGGGAGSLPPIAPSLLHERFPALRDTHPRIEICDLPTPVSFSEALGAWIKDDGLTARPWGGNKPRKLEWTLADARRRGFGTVLTFGALATNHGLATSIYAKQAGMRSVLALVDQPRDEHVERQLARTRQAADAAYLTHTKPRTAARLPMILARHSQLRPPRPPYWLPVGGSSPLGVLGFVEAALELEAQVRAGDLPEPARIVVACGSGGSAAGLAAGLSLTGLRTVVHAVVVNDGMDLSAPALLRLARKSMRMLPADGRADVDPWRVVADLSHLGAGYGHETAEAREAITFARDEAGLMLEPVYTGKAVAALRALQRSGAVRDEPVLYWHTHTASVSGSPG